MFSKRGNSSNQKRLSDSSVRDLLTRRKTPERRHSSVNDEKSIRNWRYIDKDPARDAAFHQSCDSSVIDEEPIRNGKHIDRDAGWGTTLEINIYCKCNCSCLYKSECTKSCGERLAPWFGKTAFSYSPPFQIGNESEHSLSLLVAPMVSLAPHVFQPPSNADSVGEPRAFRAPFVTLTDVELEKRFETIEGPLGGGCPAQAAAPAQATADGISLEVNKGNRAGSTKQVIEHSPVLRYRFFLKSQQMTGQRNHSIESFFDVFSMGLQLSISEVECRAEQINTEVEEESNLLAKLQKGTEETRHRLKDAHFAKWMEAASTTSDIHAKLQLIGVKVRTFCSEQEGSVQAVIKQVHEHISRVPTITKDRENRSISCSVQAVSTRGRSILDLQEKLVNNLRAQVVNRMRDVRACENSITTAVRLERVRATMKMITELKNGIAKCFDSASKSMESLVRSQLVLDKQLSDRLKRLVRNKEADTVHEMQLREISGKDHFGASLGSNIDFFAAQFFFQANEVQRQIMSCPVPHLEENWQPQGPDSDPLSFFNVISYCLRLQKQEVEAYSRIRSASLEHRAEILEAKRDAVLRIETYSYSRKITDLEKRMLQSRTQQPLALSDVLRKVDAATEMLRVGMRQVEKEAYSEDERCERAIERLRTSHLSVYQTMYYQEKSLWALYIKQIVKDFEHLLSRCVLSTSGAGIEIQRDETYLENILHHKWREICWLRKQISRARRSSFGKVAHARCRAFSLISRVHEAQYVAIDAVCNEAKGSIQVAFRSHLRQSPCITFEKLQSCIVSSPEISFGESICIHKMAMYLFDTNRFIPNQQLAMAACRKVLAKRLYTPLASVVELQTNGEHVLVPRILEQAEHIGILSDTEAFALSAVHRLKANVDRKFDRVAELIRSLYEDVGKTFFSFKSQMYGIAMALDHIQVSQRGAKRKALWVGLVKLGLSFIPIAGQMATSAVDLASAGIEAFSDAVLSESAVDILQSTLELISEVGQHQVERMAVENEDDLTPMHKRNIAAAKLGRVTLCPEFRQKLPVDFRNKLVETVESSWGASIEDVEREMDSILRTFVHVKNTSEFEVPLEHLHEENPMSAILSQESFAGTVGEAKNGIGEGALDAYCWSEGLLVVTEFRRKLFDDLMLKLTTFSDSRLTRKVPRALTHRSKVSALEECKTVVDGCKTAYFGWILDAYETDLLQNLKAIKRAGQGRFDWKNAAWMTWLMEVERARSKLDDVVRSLEGNARSEQMKRCMERLFAVHEDKLTIIQLHNEVRRVRAETNVQYTY